MIALEKLLLKKENELLYKIIESSYDGIFMVDNKGKIIYCNSAYLRISGLNKEKIMGRYMQDLINKQEIPDAASLDVLESKKHVTKNIDYYNGVSALVTSTPIFDDADNLIRVFSNVRDITELIHLREELKNTNDLNKEYQQQLWKTQYGSKGNNQFIVKSAVMQNIVRLALRVSHISSPVLIQGESGVGKDIIARFIHNGTEKITARPFIHINCSAIPETLLESELFGYESGAFTGAAKGGKRGLFELANEGTLYLDEIGEMPLTTQVKLLNVLQNNKFYRLGGTKKISVNFRIIAATNKNLEEEVKSSRFREDLYYRLNVIPIYIPPLRERLEDIVPLIMHFVETYNGKFGFNKKILSTTIEFLTGYKWPGNVRELKNVVERMVALAESDIIDEQCIPHYIRKETGKQQYIYTPDYFDSFNLKDIMGKVECEVISKALNTFGSLRKTAYHLGIDLSTLVRKKKRYKL